MKIRTVFLWCVAIMQAQLSALTIGSDLTVLKSAYVNFVSSPNTIALFAEMVDGFSLTDTAASLSFESIFPVHGDVNLNGGSLTLERNMIFGGNGKFTGLGTIVGNGNTLELSDITASFANDDTQESVLSDLTLIMHSDILLNTSLRFQGDCTIVGNGRILDLSSTGSIIVDSNASLTLRQLKLRSVSDGKVRCEDATAQLILDECIWNQSESPVIFGAGALSIKNKVKFEGDGDQSLVYQSSNILSIATNSRLLLSEHFTFSYDPSNGDTGLLQFANNTSSLYLDSASFIVTTTDLMLTKGLIMVNGDAFMGSQGGSLTFGNQVSAQDVTLLLLGGARLTMVYGEMVYKNVLASSLKFTNGRTNLYFDTGTGLRLYQSLHIDDGLVLFADGTSLARAAGMSILGSMNTLGSLTVSSF